MRKKQIALVYEIGNNKIEHVVSYLKHIKSNTNIEYIYIYYDKLSIENINKISRICNCIFIKTNKFKKAKFEIFNMLNEYKKVIYTTGKSVITNEIINKYDKDYCVKMYNNRFVEFNFKKLIKKYRMLDFAQNCELIIITDELCYKKIYQWCTINTFLLIPILRNRIDGILDIVVQKYNIKQTIINNNKIDNTESSVFSYKTKFKSTKKIDGPLVTVLMSVYNRIDYIDDAIKSILNQTYQNIEFLIVLEYTDIQQELYKKLKNYNDKRIKIIVNDKKLGLAESLNVGLKKANGKYIARMDDDDISELNRIEKQVAFLEKNKDIGIVGTFMKFFSSSNLICKLPVDNEELKVKCLYKTPLFHPTIMFRSDELIKNNFSYNDVYAEDYDLWSRVVSKMKISNIEECLYNYRLCNDNKSLQNEKIINDSHNRIMEYQLNKYLNLKFTFDQLQLLSGRIDILGNCINLDKLYKMKCKIWKKIIRANYNTKFYNTELLKNEVLELKEYYDTLKKVNNQIK